MKMELSVFVAHLLVVWSCAARFVAGDVIEGTVGTESEVSSVTCYQCGQPEVDPESDYPDSYCDVTVPNNNCKPDSKMYNLTCDIMDKIGPSPLWTR